MEKYYSFGLFIHNRFMKNAAALLANLTISLLFATFYWLALLYCVNHKLLAIIFKALYDWSFLPIIPHQVFRGLQSSYSDSFHHLVVNFPDKHLYSFCRWHIQKTLSDSPLYLQILLCYDANKNNTVVYKNRYLTCWSRILNCLLDNLSISTFMLF